MCFKKYIEIDSTAILFSKFSDKDINLISQLFDNGRIISWVSLKDTYKLTDKNISQWAQLKHELRAMTKQLIFYYSDINENGLYQNHHVIKEPDFCPSTIYSLRKYIQF